MKSLVTLIAAVFVLSGCGEVAREMAPQQAVNQLATTGAGPCHASLICHPMLGISCSGTELCVAVASQHLVECDGQQTRCQCVIDGQYYNHMTPNPNNVCLICDLNRSGIYWSTNDGYTQGGGTCKTTTNTCIDGPCAGSRCFSNSDCTSVCSGGQFVCGNGA